MEKDESIFQRTTSNICKVSVIIPVYNVAPFLSDALDSVIHQSYTNLEILIIDDGSTDGSEKICDTYTYDKRVQVIHQDNKGLSAARNAGLDIMTGDAVSFLDSDDAYHSDYVKLMVDAMERDDTDVIVCRYTTVCSPESGRTELPNAKPAIPPGIYDRSKAIPALHKGELNVSVWNKLYKSGLWSGIRFFEGHVFEDIEVSYRIIASCNSISVIDDTLYTHRKHPGSITTTRSLKNYKDRILVHSRVKRFVQSNIPDLYSENQLNAMEESQIKVMIFMYIRSFTRDSDWQMFREELRTSIIARSKEVKVKKVRTRIACMMIRFCPWMLKPLYYLYHVVSAEGNRN